MRKINEIILHCSATPEGKEFFASDIDKWHRQRGFLKIGYHYVIDIDGTIEQGRPEPEIGAHCTSHNSHSIGICYIGGMNKTMKKAKDTRTLPQKQALYVIVDTLLITYGLTLDDVHCHYEYADKACPSFKIEDFKDEYTKWKEEQHSEDN